MFDLFISYASHDRLWAKRLYEDLRMSFPTIRIFWDRDPEAIPVAADWAEALKTNATTAKHFVLLWSEKAKESNQVGPEFQAFDQNRATTPRIEGASRTPFYIPLEGQYGPLEAKQGFAELRKNQTYAPTAEDRGVSKLKEAPHRDEWQRIVLTIGDTVLSAESTQPVNLALLAMDRDILQYLDPFLNVRIAPGPTLNEFLVASGLTLADVKTRYGDNAFAWTPYGPGRTIIDLMQELRVSVNQGLSASYYFHWVPCDLVHVSREIAEKVRQRPAGQQSGQDEILFRQYIEELGKRPCAVVVDAVSLFNPIVRELFKRLGDYAKKEYAMIVSLAPNEAPGASLLYQCLRANGTPVLDGYFLPQVPATGTFARCRVNVAHVSDVEGLIRSSLGIYHLQRKKTEDNSLVALGV